MSEVTTLTLVESGEKEEAVNEAIEDLAFVPLAPIAGVIAAYSAGATYAKGDLVREGAQVYRSQAAGNKANEPKADTDFLHWAPVAVATYPLQNPSYGSTSFVK